MFQPSSRLALNAVLLWLLLLFSTTIKAQQVQFKEPVRECVRNYQVLELDSFYFSVGQFYQPSTNKFSINLIKLDLRGQLIAENRLIDNTISFYPSNHISLETTYDGNFVTTLDVMGVSPSQNGVLKFDQNLDTLWIKYPIRDLEIRSFHQIKQLPDSGFVITGYLYDQVKNMYHANLLRTDKNGQLLWEKVYKEPDTVSLHPYQVYPAPDGGFLLAGRKVYLPDGQTQDPLLIRTDSAGNLLWKKTYGGNQVDGIACAAYRDDGNIILHYTQGTHAIQQGHSYALVMAVVDDQNGQEVQKKLYQFIDGRSNLSHNLLKNGNKFIAVGQFSPEGADSTGKRHGYTLAVDKNLNDIWFKNYYAQISPTRYDDESVLYDLRLTSDGGYLSGGYVKTYDTTQLNVNLGYNGWIVKMDSMGCVEQSCVNRIGVEEKPVEEVSHLEVYPNPASHEINIQSTENERCTARLIDIRGVILRETHLNQDGRATLDIDNIPDGLYFIQVSSGNNFTALKKVTIAH